MTSALPDGTFPRLSYEQAPSGRAARTHALLRDAPALEWVEALALGSGMLGAMSFGGLVAPGTDPHPRADGERLQINHAAAWSGSRDVATQMPVHGDDGPTLLASARASLTAGDVRSAESTLQRLQSPHSQAFLPFVDLTVAVDAVPAGAPASDEETTAVPADVAYRRWLCLATARAGHEYPLAGAHGGVRHSTWAARPHDVLVHTVHNATSTPMDVTVDLGSRLQVVPGPVDAAGGCTASLTVELPIDVAPSHEDTDTHVRYDPARARTGVALVLSVTEDAAGRRAPSAPQAGPGRPVRLAPGQRLVLVLAAGITTEPGDPNELRAVAVAARERAQQAVALGSVALFEAHRAAHGELYDRVELTLGAASAGPDERADPGADGDVDLDRAALVFHLGRYLLVSGYRPGASPLTLQGLWNDELPAPWSSNYTLNINTEMNYWAAESANLPECHVPLLDWVAAAARGPGALAARALYGAGGWVLHHNSDRWGHATPVGAGSGDVAWSFWPLGGVWLARHLWDHVEFSGTTEPDTPGGATADLAYLREAWPVLASCAAFALDWIVADPARGGGATRTIPSTSPENSYLAADGRPAAAATSSTMDVALLRDLALRCRAAAGALGLAPAWLDDLEDAVAGLPDPQVGSRGELLEWSEDLPEAEPDHRHTSHLVGLYPLGQITPEGSPELAAAARRTLELRGPESTGWALAWRLALWARLHDAEQAHATLLRCLRPVPTDGSEGSGPRGGLYPNLFSAHPPFQIDGNLGYVAGVVEMLVQSHAGEVHLLPALPAAWPAGSVRGLRARGGVVVDLTWAEGALTRVTLRSADRLGATPAPVRVRCGARDVVVHLAPGTARVLDGDLQPAGARRH